MGRRNGTTVSPQKRRVLLDTLPPICYYCTTPFSGRRPATIEHIVPASRGGSNECQNLALTCAPCNHSKGYMTGVEFLESRGIKNPKTRLGHYKGDPVMQSVYSLDCYYCGDSFVSKSTHPLFCSRSCRISYSAGQNNKHTKLPIFNQIAKERGMFHFERK
jgi:hypothetical protein